MIRLLLFLSLMSPCFVHAASNISGSIVLENSTYYIVADSGCFRYLIKPQNIDSAQTMEKLKTGDQLKASGHLNPQTCEANISSIDFVGLASLLGYWKTHDGIYSIKDFNTLQFYPETGRDITNGRYHDVVIPINYHYSVVPGSGKDWVLFLSDSFDTQFATIRLNKNSATLKIFDSETGSIISKKYLSKWGSVQK